MANSISNSPIKRVIFIQASNKLSISNTPIKPVVFVDTNGQPVH